VGFTGYVWFESTADCQELSSDDWVEYLRNSCVVTQTLYVGGDDLLIG